MVLAFSDIKWKSADVTVSQQNAPNKSASRMRRAAWATLGTTSLALGIAGVFLPLLPTTPFLLLSAFAFERSSERLHNWLVNHPRWGQPIQDWRRYRAISRKAKMLSMLAFVILVAMSVAFGAPLYAIALQIAILCGVGTFILTRPLPPE